MGVWVGPGWPEAGLGTKPPGSPYLELGRRPGARRGESERRSFGTMVPSPAVGRRVQRRGAGPAALPPARPQSQAEAGEGTAAAVEGYGQFPFGGSTGSRPPSPPRRGGGDSRGHKEERDPPRRHHPGLPPPTARASPLASLTHSSVPQLMAEPEATGAGRLAPRCPLARPDFPLPQARAGEALPRKVPPATTGFPSE